MLPLHDDHAEVDELLAAVFAAIDSGNASAVFHRLDVFWARLAVHIRAEHLHLFKQLLEKKERLNVEGLPEIIDQLRHDHDYFMRELSSMIKLLREQQLIDEQTFEYLSICRSKLETVRERLKIHNKIEEGTLYPLAENGLEKDEFDILAESVQQELDNLPLRFRAAPLDDDN